MKRLIAMLIIPIVSALTFILDAQAADSDKCLQGDMRICEQLAVQKPLYYGVMGELYENGEVINKDISKAVYWYTKAAELGRENSQYSLGKIFHLGKDGIKTDMPKAIFWYGKAADQGMQSAQCALALIYEFGDGVPKNSSLAESWKKRADEKDSTRCYQLLQRLPSLSIMPMSLMNKGEDWVEARNLPATINQAPFPVCSGAATITLYLQYQCRKINSECKEKDLDKIPSVLAFAGIGLNVRDYEKYKTHDVVVYHSSGDSGHTLFVLQGLDDIQAESCFSLEQFQQRHHLDASSMENALTKLESEYDQYKTTGSVCMDCLINQIKIDFGITISPTVLARALEKDFFDKFLYDIFLKNCKTRVPADEFKLGHWPLDLHDLITYENLIAKTKMLLKQNKPFSASFYAYVKRESSDAHSDGHSFVITGYKKICDSKGKICKDYLKVLSSWGQEWQDKNSEGWIDAQNFFSYFDKNVGLDWIEK